MEYEIILMSCLYSVHAWENENEKANNDSIKTWSLNIK